MSSLYLIKIGAKPNFQKRIDRGEDVEKIVSDILSLPQIDGTLRTDGYSIFRGEHKLQFVAKFNPFYFGNKLSQALDGTCSDIWAYRYDYEPTLRDLENRIRLAISFYKKLFPKA